MADDVHRAVLMECLDELCRGSSTIVSHMTLLGGHMTSCDHTQVPGAGVPSEEVDGRGFKNIIPRSPSTLSIQSLFGSLGKGRTSPSHPHTLTPSHPHILTHSHQVETCRQQATASGRTVLPPLTGVTCVGDSSGVWSDKG